MSRPLVLAAHGTADLEGQTVVAGVAVQAAGVLGVGHHVGYVDVCGPTLEDALEGVGGTLPVVVPFFLASGYHVRHDVPSAVRTLGGDSRDGALSSPDPAAVVTPALGVEPEVIEALTARISEAAPGPRGVVLVSAGSTVEQARAEVADLARRVGERLGIPADVAFLSGPGRRPAEVTEAMGERLSRQGGPAGSEDAAIVLAAHLLAPGHFVRRAHRAAEESTAAGVRAVPTGPLGTHPALINLVVRRYRELVG